MGAEVLLYGYGLICIFMLVFNVIYSYSYRQKDEQRDTKRKKYLHEIKEQLIRIQTHEQIDEQCLSSWKNQLSRVQNLSAFDTAMEEIMKQEPILSAFMDQSSSLWLYLSMIYKDREHMQSAYFAYVLSKYGSYFSYASMALQEVMLSYIKKDNLYCRMNALQALYAFGSCESIVEAITWMDRYQKLFHDKILTDGLLTFQGCHEQLITLLWQNFDIYQNKTKLAILNYIRFQSDAYGEAMLNLMRDEQCDKELRLSAIRYFARYGNAYAKSDLLTFALDKNPDHWEYATIAISALDRYYGEDVERALIEALHSGNWYVRSNAADILARRQMVYSDLQGIMDSHDRYAKEMMIYQLSRREKQKGA